MIKEMFGIIFIVISISRMAYLCRNGFELKYRNWVKKVIIGLYGIMFAVGTCLLMGL